MKMKRILSFAKGALGLAALVAFVLLLVGLFGPLSQRVPMGQQAYPIGTVTPLASLPPATATPEPYPPPVPLPDTPTPGPYPPPRTPMPVPFEPTLTPRPTPTEPPVPTPLPTPVITPIPLASPPFIPGIEDKPTEPYKIVLRKGNVVWIMNSDGSDRQMLIDTESKASLFLGHSPNPEGFIRWGSPSPDGKKLALVLCDVWEERPWPPAHFSIYVFEIDTGEFNFLVEGVEPVWSPDGQWIVYQGSDSGLWVVDMATGEAEEIFSVEKGCYEATDFAWSPDGKRIAFLKRETGLGGIPEMLAVNADGSGEAAQLIPRTGWAFGGLRWSPDGRKIYYSSGAGEYTGPEIAGNLWAMDADGSHQIQLTQDISILSADLSPDGNWLVFSGLHHYEELEPPYNLWLVSLDGSGLQRLTKDSISDDHHPRWSPDGTQIVFERGDENGIWTINLSDGSLRQVYPDNVDFAIVR
jgi:Tol biopolymer transport system component